MAPGVGLRPAGDRHLALTGPLRNATRDTILAERPSWAVTAATRTRGLLDQERLDHGEALVISPCNSVHMFGMRFALDVIFVDADGVVVRAIEDLRPGRFTRIHLRAKRAIELPVGTIAATGTRPGDRLELGPIPEGGEGGSMGAWWLLVAAGAGAALVLASR